MSATTNYNYSLTFRVPPSAAGFMPAKRTFRSNSPESGRISAAPTNATATTDAEQEPATAITAATATATTPVNTLTLPRPTAQHLPWQWKLTLTEEQPPQEGEENKREGCSNDTAGGGGGGKGMAEVTLSIELRGLSTSSRLPSSAPFGGFLLQYKSFSLVAKHTQFTLVSKTIEAASALSLQASVKANHVLDLEGHYIFTIVLSTESLTHETAMAPLGFLFSPLFLPFLHDGYSFSKSIDAIFDDPVSTDVVFIWENKVMLVNVDDGNSEDESEGWIESGSERGSEKDGFGNEGQLKKRYCVTLSRLYAHQVVLRQYPYFRRKLPLPSPSSSQGRGAGGGGSTCVVMPRMLLVRDFSLPAFRLVLKWLYTRTVDTAGIVDATPTVPTDRPQELSSSSSSMTMVTMPWDGHGEAPVTWMEVYHIADNFELDELRELAKKKLFKFE